jgi:hypothetical protein
MNNTNADIPDANSMQELKSNTDIFCGYQAFEDQTPKAVQHTPPLNFQRRRRCSSSDSLSTTSVPGLKNDRPCSESEAANSAFSRKEYNRRVAKEIESEISRSEQYPSQYSEASLNLTILVLSQDPADCGSED